MERRVVDYHNEHGTFDDEGCHVNAVAAGLGVELALVRATVDYLCSEGHLYATIDEEDEDGLRRSRPSLAAQRRSFEETGFKGGRGDD